MGLPRSSCVAVFACGDGVGSGPVREAIGTAILWTARCGCLRTRVRVGRPLCPSRSRLLAPTPVLLLLITMASARPGAASNCSFPGNPVPNCGFTTDLSGGWYFTGDSAVHVANDGASGPGCAAVNRRDSVGAIEAVTACAPALAGVEYGGRVLHAGVFRHHRRQLLRDGDRLLRSGLLRRHIDSNRCGGVAGVRLEGVRARLHAAATTDTVQLHFACWSSVDCVVRSRRLLARARDLTRRLRERQHSGLVGRRAVKRE